MDVRTYTKDRGLTLSELAKMLGVSVTTLHGYITGRRGVPVRIVAEVEKISGGLVKAADWLPASGSSFEQGTAA
ncbi:helix-turn-helix domain-containing protein [Acetobacter ascendens]|uniref:helix-turn-helix domain-containing protein n=1 Tax=Acetobacter ascendens TaxID=481146 RepID=UPI000875E7BC|nr:helix-turn-helix transcriptional regulator [Acetobacter ascendens]AOW49403.1 hypothetical protein A4R89_08225 [Acetobacter ascendens]